MITARASDHPCELHKTHSPRNLTVEFHHLVPVAWQQKVQPFPDPAPFSGIDPDGRGRLWDARGIWACPTGHRNVHDWIELLMHRIAETSVEDVAAAEKAVLAATKEVGHVPAEFPQAVLGLQRAQPYVSLLHLTSLGEWGQV